MARPGQKSLNLWIPEQIHGEIKLEAQYAGITVKEYILTLHRLQVEKKILTSDVTPSKNSELQEMKAKLRQLEREVAKIPDKIHLSTLKSVQDEPILNTETQDATPLVVTSKPDLTEITSNILEELASQLPMEQISKDGESSNKDLSSHFSIKEDKSIVLPIMIEEYLNEIKRVKPRTRVRNYKETLTSIMNGNHSRKSIEEYRGFIFHNTTSKNCEKPLIALEKLGLIEIRFENPSKPNQKSYYIANNFLPS